MSCVTLAWTDGSFHLGQAVTTYVSQDIDLGYEPHIFQYFVSVCILIGHVVMPRLELCTSSICSVQDFCLIRMLWFWPLALKAEASEPPVLLVDRRKWKYWQFKLYFHLPRKYLLVDASLVTVFTHPDWTMAP